MTARPVGDLRTYGMPRTLRERHRTPALGGTGERHHPWLRGSALNANGRHPPGRLGVLLAGAREPGVYRWRSRAHPGALHRDLTLCGWALHPLDGRGITSPARLYDACAYRMRFPAWFVPDWDALAYCLSDLSWLPGRGHVLLWDRY